MSTNTSENTPQPEAMKATRSLDSINQRIARVREDILAQIRRLEKSRSFARYVVGELVLDNPTAWAAVVPLINNELAKRGRPAEHVAKYHNAKEEIDKLRDLMP
jgi:hypothetical protein